MLLAMLGANNLYGQEKPTLTININETDFCESGTATVDIVITGLGTKEFEYEFDLNGDGDSQSSRVSENITTWGPRDFTFTGNGYFKVNYIHDDNYPLGSSESGQIIDGRDGSVLPDGRIDIKVDKKPTPVIDPTIKTCRREITMTAEPGGENTKVEWLDVIGGNYLTRTDTKATLNADAVGNYDITYQVTNGACVESDTKTFYIDEQAMPSANFDLLKDRICSDESTELLITGDGENRYPLELTYSDGTDTYIHQLPSANESTVLSPDSKTTYTMIKLVDREECDASLSETLVLDVDEKPDPTAGVYDSPICGYKTQLFAQNVVGDNFEWEIRNPKGSGLIFVNEEGKPIDSERKNKEAWVQVDTTLQWRKEEYTLHFSDTVVGNKTCIGKSFVVVEFYKDPSRGSLGDDVSLYIDDSHKFLALNLDSMELEWNLPLGVEITDNEDDYFTLNGLSKGENLIECIVSNGSTCEIVYLEKVVTVNSLYKTTGFSPNASPGVNDYFIIGGAENVKDNKLTVFDVTGKVVYEEIDFCHSKPDKEHIGWDGFKNDGKREDGTYYYIFTGKHDGKDIDPIKSYLIIKGSK